MIWQSPWAWLGLATIALPGIVHLLSRGHARVHRFPTLRFIDASRLLPTRRTRVNDLPLLVVRAGILSAAAAALAQPLFLTAKRSRAANASLARVIIVDTSGNVTPGDVNRATRLASDVASSTVLSTDDPASVLPGAVAWLETQPMRGEIVVVSRFPVGSLDSIDIARIPARLGVKLVRIPSTAIGPFEKRTRSQGETIARVTPSADRTDVEWSAARAAGASVEPLIFAGATERDRVNAARAAAATIPVGRRSPSAASIAVVEPGYEGRDTLERSATEPRAPWMMDIVARLASDSLLAGAARRAAIVAPSDTTARMVVVARTDSGLPVVLAGEDSVAGRRRLTLYSLADAGSLTSAALLAAIAHATSLETPWAVYEPSVLSDEVLAGWQREPSVERRPRPNPTTGSAEGDSDARWLWIVALVLLGIEGSIRRERRVATARGEAVRERAA